MRLKELLEYKDIVVQCHDNPDADALASGYAVWWYLKKKGREARFIYRGRNMIQKSNLMIMVDKLKIPVEYEPDLEITPELLVLVDCQYGERNVSALDAGTIAVIDHHMKGTNTVPMSEVRSNVGSCATVVWDMLKQEGLDVNEDRLLATALYYGLFTDTNKFAEMSHPLDRDMVDNLIIYRGIITEMSNSNISLRELKITGRAILDYKYNYDNRYMVIEAERCDPNILGVISDFVMETAGVNVCLAYYVTSSEVKFSVRSCIKEVHADELAAFLANGLGGGGGHMYKAGGMLRAENLPDAAKTAGVDIKAESNLPASDERVVQKLAHYVFAERLKEYYDKYQIIYSKDTVLDKEGMELYEKVPQELGAVKLSEVYPVGTLVEIRTLEGDIELMIDDEKYLMIGIEGEIYPISAEKLRRSYKILSDTYTRSFEYEPRIKNISSNEVKMVRGYSKTVISTDKSRIYAKPLDKSLKLFTEWDEERYYLGEPGDYIACRKDDEHDIYIIRGNLFPRLYKKTEE